VFFVLILFP